MSAEAAIAFMTRALVLARAQLGRTAPNPSVGCVIVSAFGAIVAEGATGDGGRPHAEEIALGALGGAAAGACAYVSLAPCGARSSGGSSCAHLLIAAGIRQVFCAVRDPDPHGAAGLSVLRAAGVEVHEGLMEAPARRLNAGFFHRVDTGRPLAWIDDDPSGYDCALSPARGEDIRAALSRLGDLGMTRVFASPGTDAALALSAARLAAPAWRDG